MKDQPKKSIISTLFNTLNITHLLGGSKFIQWGFCRNTWVWLHMIGGGLLAHLFMVWNSPIVSLLGVLVTALLWEAVEAFVETPTKDDMRAIYGSVERYAYDSIGDILGAVVIAALAVL